MKISRLLLLCLLLFVAVTAIVAGIDMMVYPTGVLFRMHPLMLANSPFSNFFVPGTICLIAIGGSSLTAVLLLR
ncbi:MAG TPA: hypothetical protein VHB48_02550, partial [Chitinophagaceae bacterium]|nr:hypothetical protein [Chitinophagaceae bacterium]